MLCGSGTLQCAGAAHRWALVFQGALLSYAEQVHALVFAKHTVKAVYEGEPFIAPPPTTTSARNAFNGEPHAVPEGKLALEFQTIKALEIIANSRTGKHEKSLFGVINHTQASYVVWATTNARTRVCRDRCDCEQTRVGQRLLRATLLSPSNDAVTINLRLDCIGELLSSQEVFFHCNEVGHRARHTDERPSARGVLTVAYSRPSRFCVSSRIWTVSSISWSSNPGP